MKKLLGVLLVLTALIFTGCDNNEGPFQVKNENGEKVLYSGEKPAKGWVQNEVYNSSGESTKVYEIYFDKGVPAGDFKLYDLKGNLLVDAKGKWQNGLFEGKIEEPERNAIVTGKFAINPAYLINFSGTEYYDFSAETLIDGEYKSDYRTYSKKNNEYDGEYILYNRDNGQLLEKCFFQAGELVGDYISYYSNGTLRKKCTYKDGKYDGEYEAIITDFYSHYSHEKKNYKNGVLHGKATSYNKKGELTSEMNYVNGKVSGYIISYSDGWTTKSLYGMVNGYDRLVHEQVYDEKGVLRYEEVLDKEKKVEIEKRYSSSGKLLYKKTREL